MNPLPPPFPPAAAAPAAAVPQPQPGGDAAWGQGVAAGAPPQALPPTAPAAAPAAAPPPAAAAAAAPSGAVVATGSKGRTRKRGVTVCCPIVYGSIAFWLGKKADELHTHRWTIFVRGPNNEDISYLVSKVVFHLHSSFPEPTRVLTKYPYQVTEMGWGEFDIKISLHFNDPAESPLDIVHHLKLYPDPSTTLTTHVPVMSEHYDEVVFTDPTEEHFDKLMEGQDGLPMEHEFAEHFERISDTKDLQTLVSARQYIHSQLADVKNSIMRIDSQLSKYKGHADAAGGIF